MNLNQLKIFYLAAKHGSLSAAAEAMFITQPAVTKGIQRLQEHYEIKLFNRFGRKMALTDAGEVLYGIAESIFEMENQAEESLRDFQQASGLHPDPRQREFRLLLPSFHTGPVLHGSSQDPDLRGNPADGSDRGEDGNAFKRYRLHLLPCAAQETALSRSSGGQLPDHRPPGHPFALKPVIEPEDLAGHALIVHEQGSAPAKHRRVHPETQYPCLDSPRAFQQRGDQDRRGGGLGVAVITRRVVSKEIGMGKLKAIPLSDPAMTRKFYLIHHKDKYISRPLQA